MTWLHRIEIALVGCFAAYGFAQFLWHLVAVVWPLIAALLG